MAIAEDVSSPAVSRSAISTIATSLVTTSFTPPAGAYLLVMANIGLYNARTSAPSGITITSSGGTSAWTTVQFKYDSGGTYNYGGVYVAQVTTSQAMTVTMTRPEATTGDMQMAVRVITGCGGIGASAATLPASTVTIAGSLTPTQTGSILYAAAGFNNSATFTANGSTTSIDVWNEGTNIVVLATGKATALTSSLSPVTLGWTASTSGWAYLILAEAIPGAAAAAGAIPPRRVVNRVALIRSSNF